MSLAFYCMMQDYIADAAVLESIEALAYICTIKPELQDIRVQYPDSRLRLLRTTRFHKWIPAKPATPTKSVVRVELPRYA